MVRRALLAALLTLLVVASDAHACSCAAVKPRAALREAEAAFTGHVVAIRRGERRAVFTFRVHKWLRGNFGRRVRVHTAAYGSACGLELDRGDRAGLILERGRGDRWEGGLCGQYGARELRRAARGLPQERRACRAEDADGARALRRLAALVSRPLLAVPLLRFAGPTGRLPT